MKKAKKKYLKNNLISFIVGTIIFGTIGIYAIVNFSSSDVSYNNANSGLSSTNVKGAIDELYTECTAISGGEQILEQVQLVTSGDGLYEDEYEDGRYIYKGANPNNYIIFNNEKPDNYNGGWRIISLEHDGTIKIMRDESIGNIQWDHSAATNDWSSAALKTYLNSTYYNNLTNTAKNQIVESAYSVGKLPYDDTFYYFDLSMQEQINDENSVKWSGKIALATLSEYIRASSNINCQTIYGCRRGFQCAYSNWMLYGVNLNKGWWTLTPVNYKNYVFAIDPQTIITINMSSYDGGTFEDDPKSFTVRPVVTLSSKIKITGGDGSKNNPYTIE